MRRCHRSRIVTPVRDDVRLLSLAAALVVRLLQLRLVSGGGQGQPPIGLPNCLTVCGGVQVPYPFGIGPGCHLLGFDLTCNTNHTPPRLFLRGNDGLQVTNISHVDSTLLLLSPGVMAAGPSELSGVAAPASLFISKQQLLQWKLLSSALQEPNETRPGNEICPQDLGSTACHSRYSTCQATTALSRTSTSVTSAATHANATMVTRGTLTSLTDAKILMSARFRLNASAIAQIYLEIIYANVQWGPWVTHSLRMAA
ncbi:unnamed protein product [Urochloa humidicola]